MQPASLPAAVQAYAPDFARRLGLILAALAALIARRFPLSPRLVPLLIPLWTRLNRTARRCARLMALLAAGRLPRPRRAHPGGPHGARPLPTGRFWLIAALGHEGAVCATQLESLLAEPAAAALLAEIPAARRLVHPIGRLLGLTARTRVPAPRPPRPPRPRPPPLPPIRPTSPYPSAKWPWLDRSFHKRD